jgi:hypothetical protein
MDRFSGRGITFPRGNRGALFLGNPRRKFSSSKENLKTTLYVNSLARNTDRSLFFTRSINGAVHAQELELAAVRFGTLDVALEF